MHHRDKLSQRKHLKWLSKRIWTWILLPLTTQNNNNSWKPFGLGEIHAAFARSKEKVSKQTMSRCFRGGSTANRFEANKMYVTHTSLRFLVFLLSAITYFANVIRFFRTEKWKFMDDYKSDCGLTPDARTWRTNDDFCWHKLTWQLTSFSHTHPRKHPYTIPPKSHPS